MRELLDAYTTRRPVEPISGGLPELTVDEAYAIQRAQVDVWLERGRVIRGHKIGLTSKAMQTQMGIDQPDFGVLFADMFHSAERPVPVDRYLQPRVEPEVGFVLDRDLAGPGLTVDDVAAAVRSVHAALEIIDSRIVDWRIGLVDTIADNASSGGVVLGDQLAVDPSDLAAVDCVFEVNGAVYATGVGADVQGTPLGAMTWLANRLGEFGVRLEEGHVVLSGSITRAAPVAAGDRVTAAFPGLGAIRATFA